MNPLDYLARGSAVLAIGWLAYRYLLRDTPYFGLNRAFLLAVLGLGLLNPLLDALSLPASSGGTALAALQLPEVWAGAGSAVQNSPQVLLLVWFGGMAVFALSFALQGLGAWRALQRLPRAGAFAPNLRVAESGPCYAVFGQLVLSRQVLDDPAARERILAHEQAHLQQAHALDQLLAELTRIAFWFHPMAWLLSAAVRENSEFLADRAALRLHPGSRSYGRLLLEQTRQAGACPSLVRNRAVQPFYTSSLTRRLAMLHPKHRAALPALRSFTAAAMLLISALSVSRAQLPPEKSRQAGAQSTQNPADSAGTQAVTNPESMPEFPGGQEALFRFLGENLRYPEKAKEDGVEGRVFVQFTVDASGAVRDAKVLRGISPECDSEALRVVRAMPNWKPGMLNSVPVSVVMTLPFAFALR